MTIDVEIISDAVCPWCYVGRRRLEAAIESIKGTHDVRIRWKPFELNPDMPKEGMDRHEYLNRKFGGAKTVEEMNRRMAAVGEQEGIPFALDKIRKSVNTFDAHRLIWWAAQRNLDDAVADGLFRAYFTKGRDVGDREVLADIAARAGLDCSEAKAFLSSDEGVQEVRAEEMKARNIGVDSVPTFIIGGRILVAGAQTPDVFLEAFESL
jgi:predicted DsbA family dithiol-disulfide isomerase